MKQISNVVKSVFAAMLACVVVFSAFSCEKSGDVTSGNETGEPCSEGTLVVSIATRAESGQQNLSGENKVNMLELFVFRNEGNGIGDLDAYKKIDGGALLSLNNLEIRSTTGKKIVYAVLNSHNEDWSGVKTLSDFKNKLACLKNEKPDDFTMAGSAETTLQLTTQVAVEVSRLVAKVQLSGIRCDFSGTPYEGTSLTDVKVYLTNAYACKSYALNANGTTPHILNSKGYVAGDVSGCAVPSVLYKEIGNSVGSAVTNVGHNFYCYENMVAQESSSERFTRLVVEGKLNGHTYYYPVNINRAGFGYTSSVDHVGVRRNTAYTIDITICRPGSTDPDGVLEYGDLKANVTVKDWVTIPGVQVQF